MLPNLLTSRDHKQTKLKKQKKTDETAAALAINDYIAGKRSKEEINKLIVDYAAKAEFAKGSVYCMMIGELQYSKQQVKQVYLIKLEEN